MSAEPDFKPFECVDCGENTHHENEYYMVHDQLWSAAGMAPRGGMLCIGCLEDRLGRKLCSTDFTSALINRPGIVGQSDRFRGRLRRNPAVAI